MTAKKAEKKLVAVKSIRMERIDGRKDEVGAVEVKTYQEASDVIRAAARSAPVETAHRVNFEVIFEDGQMYEGVVAMLAAHAEGGYDLGHHIREFAERHCGKRKPAELSQHQYDAVLKKVPAEQRKFFERLLTEYDISGTPSKQDDRPLPTCTNPVAFRFGRAIEARATEMVVEDPHAGLNLDAVTDFEFAPDPLSDVPVGPESVDELHEVKYCEGCGETTFHKKKCFHIQSGGVADPNRIHMKKFTVTEAAFEMPAAKGRC